MNYLTYDGYPTEEYLQWLENYNPFDEGGFSKLLESLEESHLYSDIGYYELKRQYDGKRTLWYHTGGWSGHESIIYSLRRNIYFWMHWRRHDTGGHYKFRVPIDKKYEQLSETD